MPDFDAIVVGAGHNGLVCAAYLARAGMRTLLVEARDTVGGCASSESFGGGTVNICNCDHITFRTTPVMEELGLAEHGLRYIEVDPGQLSVPWPSGPDDHRPAWPVFHDVERTIDGLRRLYPHEVEGYQQFAKAAIPALQLILAAAVEPPTPRGLIRTALSRRDAAAMTLLRWSRHRAADVLRNYFREEAILGPALSTGPVVWGVRPDMAKTGLGALSLAMRHVANVGRPVGGSGMVPAALVAAFDAAGGVLKTGRRVAAIRCDGQRVCGVELEDGVQLDAPIVVSACDPHATFLQWLRDPPAGAAKMLKRWRGIPQYEGYESKVDAIVAEPPRYRCVDPAVADELGFDPLHPSAMIAPPVSEIISGHVMMSHGHVMPRPVMFANVPSVLDPSMSASSGHHVFSLECLYTPYGLQGGWDGSEEPRRWLRRYESLVQPGFVDGIVEWRAMTPDRYEREFGLPLGHATGFAGGPIAAFANRNPELTHYETAVPGLFLTGAATFPGAGIWGASGRNCATVVIRNAG